MHANITPSLLVTEGSDVIEGPRYCDMQLPSAQALRLSMVIAETVHKPKKSTISRELYLEHIPATTKPTGGHFHICRSEPI